MAAAIRDDNPVCYLINYLLVLEHGDVPEGEYVVPFGEAAVRRDGSDVTIVATGWTVGRALARPRRWRRGDPGRGDRSAHAEPLDTATILASVEKTGRLVIADQGTRHGGAVRGDRGRGRRARVRIAEGADQAGDGARRDRPLQRADGGVRPAQRGKDRPRASARSWVRRPSPHKAVVPQIPRSTPRRRTSCYARCGGSACSRSGWRS